MAQQVPAGVKRERMQRMLALGRELSEAFQRRFLGREMNVLWETSRPGGNGYRQWEGLTDNYMRVFAESALPLENKLTPARLAHRFETGIWGEVIG
jgi:threonylcarbamoyladenosine tRNA methylthiotransferase MtaB